MCQLIVLLTFLLIGVSEGTSIAKRQSSDEPNYQQLLDQVTALQSQVATLQSKVTRLRSITAKLLGAENRGQTYFIQYHISTLLLCYTLLKIRFDDH